MGVDEDRKRQRHQAQLQQRRRPRHIHQRPALRLRADQWHHPLRRRHQQRQDQRKMAYLYKQLTAP